MERFDKAALNALQPCDFRDYMGQEMRKPGSEGGGPGWMVPPSSPWETVLFSIHQACFHHLPLSSQQWRDLALPGAIKAGWGCGQPPLVLGTQGQNSNERPST
ncbi:vacuolar ATPase assembly integral membrane protein VMA21 isoform X2 [Mesoplodon densirostris]|uniref:vacuolar ATPase assembly integral membrane protein VMA21 isoform X2 n=1 Tax=Mesoplodon densirostris TaxID=48708 RepID=UPI0028DB0107|nr:vacuolar ATPase assembly integral membrane protein VMA21 isoform X2 [Mesoplodon densirostris]